jgi:hypothetical protein
VTGPGPGPALDLARIRAALARLDALAMEHPELADRGEALERDLEDWMAEDEGTKGGVPVKLPVELLERADALISAVRADPELSAMMGRVSRAAVVRVALLKGLNELEKQAAKRAK